MLHQLRWANEKRAWRNVEDGEFRSAAHVLQASSDARFDNMACMAGRNQNEIKMILAI
jgi:hypothetical protein